MNTHSAPAVLLTGRPGVGKTTLIMRTLDTLRAAAGGFYTREVRRAGARIGFEIVALNGQTAMLAVRAAGKTFSREARLGMWRVDLDAIEGVAVPALQQAAASGGLVVVDEIGPMEIFSTAFCTSVGALLDQPIPLLGTIVQRPYRFADAVKRHPRVHLVTVTPANRDDLLPALTAQIRGRTDR